MINGGSVSSSQNTASSQSKLIIIAGIAAVGMAFFGGTLWGKIQVYENGGVITQANTGTETDVGNQAAPAAAPPQPTTGTASVDDDPVLGDANAPITMIEFSDYECPFCKRYFDDTLGQIIENYVDTGKVKIVFRDLPLGFHDPMATNEAIAANCAREQGGDSKYFEYHDEIFNRTTSNGNGLSEEDLITIATDVGLNVSAFNTCRQDPDQEAEVKKDLADAGTAGATGTPTFLIGKSTSNGEIEGDLIVGAQPYSAFETAFNSLE